MNTQTKQYIGQTEAWEICLQNGMPRLPRTGKQIMVIYSTLENNQGKANWSIGKDQEGYFIDEVTYAK